MLHLVQRPIVRLVMVAMVLVVPVLVFVVVFDGDMGVAVLVP